MKQKLIYKVKGIGLSLLLSLLFHTSYSQIAITDTGNCLSHTLHASLVGTIPTSSGITADDGYSGLIPIGFTFNFYGTNYTQLLIGSNGMLTFTPSLAGAYDPWPISAALLGNSSAYNSICGPWCDIYIPSGGTITYSTLGTAPNRKFAVTFCGTAMYSCTTQWTTSQIIIYETTNNIEVHTAHHTICAWNGGYAITGVQNATGTLATVAPGRDYPANWVCPPVEGWQFVPVGPSYTVSSIPYAPAPYATSAIYWYDSTTGAYLGSGPYLTVTPVVGTTYEAVALGCNDSTKAFMHIEAVSITGGGGVPHINNATFANPSECGKCDGSITLYGVAPHQVDSVFYSIGGVAQPIIVDSASLDSVITLPGLCAGTYDYVYVKVGSCPSNEVGPFNLVTPILAISHIVTTNPTICGRFDGTIKLYGLTPLKPYSLTYNKGTVPQPTLTGYVASDSSVTITGLEAADYNTFAATVGLCTAPWPDALLIDPPAYPASFTFNVHPGCNGDSVFVTNTSAPTGFYSYWNFDSSDPMDSLHAFYVYHDESNPTPFVGSATIVLTYNTTNFHKAACQTTSSATVNFDHHIQAAFGQDRDTMCLGVPVQFVNNTSVANPALYHWDFGDKTGTSDLANPSYAYPLPSATIWTTTLTATDSIVGCKSTATHDYNVILVHLAPPADTSVCLKDSMLMREGVLTVVGAPESVATYEWTMSADGSAATNLSDNTVPMPYFFGIGTFPYELTVTINTAPDQLSGGCVAHGDQTVYSYPPITFINVTQSQMIALGSSIQLNAEGAMYYTWTPDNGTLNNTNIHNPIAKPTDSVTTYVVHARTEYGCLDSTVITIYVDQTSTDMIPSAFTPNGDGKNDKFSPGTRFKFQKLVDMRVYNRWGVCMFQSSNAEDGWDGNFHGVPQDMGVYTYEVIVAQPDGSDRVYKGTVTLIR